MSPDTIALDDLFLVGKRVRLGTTWKDNQQIAQAFWKDFNKALRSVHMPMGKPWIKYGITLREEGQLYYLCAVPTSNCYPEDFELFHIPRGTFLRYTHTGDMSSLSTTIDTIWNKELPTTSYQSLSTSLRYIEIYKEGFQFEQANSVIEILIPVISKPRTEFPVIPAKTILVGSGAPEDITHYKHSWFGMDFNMNLYKGCCHGCVYCDSRSNCYQVENFDIVRGKTNALNLLEQELKCKRRKGTVGIGAMSDTYNPFEVQQCLTRGALKLLLQYGYGVGLDTKSTLILRDIDLLQAIARQYPSIIKVTITCWDDATAKLLEPYAPPSSERFAVVKTLRDAGLFTGILLMPILPFINDTEENILGIVRKAHEASANFIFAYGGFGVTLRDHQRDYFYYWLDQHFPGMRKTYEQHFHKVYSCSSPHARRLYKLFEKECRKYGILYRMSDIIRAYKPQIPNQQMALPL